jgi:hypothetical protein
VRTTTHPVWDSLRLMAHSRRANTKILSAEPGIITTHATAVRPPRMNQWCFPLLLSFTEYEPSLALSSSMGVCHNQVLPSPLAPCARATRLTSMAVRVLRSLLHNSACPSQRYLPPHRKTEVSLHVIPFISQNPDTHGLSHCVLLQYCIFLVTSIGSITVLA